MKVLRRCASIVREGRLAPLSARTHPSTMRVASFCHLCVFLIRAAVTLLDPCCAKDVSPSARYVILLHWRFLMKRFTTTYLMKFQITRNFIRSPLMTSQVRCKVNFGRLVLIGFAWKFNAKLINRLSRSLVTTRLFLRSP